MNANLSLFEDITKIPASAVPERESLAEAALLYAKELKRLKLLDAVAANNIEKSVGVLLRSAAASGRSAPEPVEEDLERVGEKLARHIQQFFAKRQKSGLLEFHAEDLKTYVASKVLCAPGSPDRVMRDLRKQGKIDYVVVSRRGSSYRIVGKP